MFDITKLFMREGGVFMARLGSVGIFASGCLTGDDTPQYAFLCGRVQGIRDGSAGAGGLINGCQGKQGI